MWMSQIRMAGLIGGIKSRTNSPKSTCLLCHAGASSGFIWGLPTIPHSLHSQYNISLLLNLFSWSYNQCFLQILPLKTIPPPSKMLQPPGQERLCVVQCGKEEGRRQHGLNTIHQRQKCLLKYGYMKCPNCMEQKQIAWGNILMKEWTKHCRVCFWKQESM